jgi:hypothetical protein
MRAQKSIQHKLVDGPPVRATTGGQQEDLVDEDLNQLDLGLECHKPIKRYALFKDFRGVLYCEPVDEMLIVYERPTRARPARYHKNGLFKKPTLVEHARPAGKAYEVVFDPLLCNRSDYFHTTKFEGDVDMEALGWVRSQDRVYLQENYWGPVTAIAITTDLELGERLQKKLWLLTPEGNRMVSCFHRGGLKHRDNKAKPVFTIDAIENLEQLAA